MNYQNIDAATARQLIRSGKWNRPTTGMALGYVQANLVILPQSWAEEFATFCHLNPQSAPLLDMTSPGNPHPLKVAPDADLRSDVPRYRVYREGRVVEEPTDIQSYWQEDFVAFLLGCSFSAERALLEQGVPLRHLEQNKNISMYKTSRLCVSTPRFHGPLVVTMRPFKPVLVERVISITGNYPLAHGAPIHIGDPLELGISDLSHPEWGDVISMHDDDIPVFWACGVTPQAVIQQVKPEIAITHAPGHMFITDWTDTDIYQSAN